MQTLRDIGNGEWGELVVGSRALSPVLHSNLYIPSTTKTQMNFALFCFGVDLGCQDSTENFCNFTKAS